MAHLELAKQITYAGVSTGIMLPQGTDSLIRERSTASWQLDTPENCKSHFFALG